MKLLVFVFIILLSFLMAALKANELKSGFDKSVILLGLAEKLKKNYTSDILPANEVCESFLKEKYGTKIDFSALDDVTAYLKEEFYNVSGINEYCEALSRFSVFSASEMPLICEKLLSVAEDGHKKTAEKYKKDTLPSYLMYPGVTFIALIILL